MTEKDESRASMTESTPEEEAYYAEQAAEMTKAYRVRGRMIPLFGVLTSLLFTMLVPLLYGWIPREINAVTVLVAGALISLIAIPFHILGGRDKIRSGLLRSLFYVVSILINTLGTSLCMTAYYIHLGKEPTCAAMLLGVLVPVVLFAAVCLLVQVMPNRYGTWTGIASLLTVVLIVVSIVFWVRSDSQIVFSFAFFDLLWTLIAVIALHVACSDEESAWLRFSSFASFGILMAVAVIVLVILACVGGADSCDCDCGDGCGDCCDCGGCDCGGGETEKASSGRGRKK